MAVWSRASSEGGGSGSPPGSSNRFEVGRRAQATLSVAQ